MIKDLKKEMFLDWENNNHIIMKLQEDNNKLWELVYLKTPSTGKRENPLLFDQSTKSSNQNMTAKPAYSKMISDEYLQSHHETMSNFKNLSFVTFEPKSQIMLDS